MDSTPQRTAAGKDDHESEAGWLVLSQIRVAWRSFHRWRRGIGPRLLVRVLLFSSAITLILTLFQLYFDYRYDVRAIESRLSEIEGSYVQSLGGSLWNLDRRQIELQIEGILLTMYDERTNLARQVAEDLKEFFADQVLTTVIPRSIRLAEAPSYGKPILMYDPRSRGAESYIKLAKEILANEQRQRQVTQSAG